VKVYGGTDPLTGREIRLRKTCKTERAAQIELGKLLEHAAAGRQPETNATVAELMDQYAEVADWDLSTRKANEAYIRRVIKPALGTCRSGRSAVLCSTCSARSPADRVLRLRRTRHRIPEFGALSSRELT
jgi:hypothetical protein